MKVIIKATKLELTPAIYDYINEKIGSLGRFVKKFEIRNEIKVEIEIARSTKHHRHGNIFYAEANMRLPDKTLRAEHYDWDIRVAIDKIKDKLQQEIKSYKSKKLISRRKGTDLRGKK